LPAVPVISPDANFSVTTRTAGVEVETELFTRLASVTPLCLKAFNM
jgi:hypothetical protein